MDVTKKIEDIINSFKEKRNQLLKNEELELEIRVPINKDAFDNMLDVKELNGKWKLELSINIISSTIYERRQNNRYEKQYRQQILFDKTEKKSVKYYEKIRMHYPIHINDYLPYSIHLNKEVEVNSFPSQSSAIVRFRVRASTVLNVGDLKWILDLTAIRQVEFSAIKDIKNLRDQMFGAIKVEKGTITGIRHDLITNYELELELDKNAAVSKLNPNSFGVIKWIWAQMNPNYSAETLYQAEIYNIASYIYEPHIAKNFTNSEYRLKRLGNQVRVLTKADYYKDIYPPIGYYITIKADGARAFVTLRNNVLRIISDKLLEFGKSSNVNTLFEQSKTNIADAEMIEYEDKITIWLFDVICINDENVSELDFRERIKFLPALAETFNKYIASIKTKLAKPLEFAAKKYVELTEYELEKQIVSTFTDKYPFMVDGVIITAPRGSYRNTNNYKWKPSNMNTIDFLAVKVDGADLVEIGLKPNKKLQYYFLYVGINIQMFDALMLTQLPNYLTYFPKFESKSKYFPVHFASSANPRTFVYATELDVASLDRKIIELRWIDTAGELGQNWEYVRTRTDREGEINYYGNDYRIAELTFMNYIDKFDISDLFRTAIYFNKSTDISYHSGNRLRRQLFDAMLKKYVVDPKKIVDMACGRGADIFRYSELGATSLLCIDNDSAAIAALIRRKLDNIISKKNTSGERAIKIKTLVADLNTDYKKIMEKYAEYGLETNDADALICNFAIHYMCVNTDTIANIINFAACNLQKGGIWIITCFNGREIFNNLKKLKKGEKWELSDMGKVKYAITKDYSSDQFSNAGQKINVMLPFSSEEYEEYLVNFDYFTKVANECGFRLLDNKSFGELAATYGTKFKNLIDGMTNEDNIYNSLYSLLVYVKE